MPNAADLPPQSPPSDPLALARHVVRGCDKAVLAVSARAGTPEAGAPYASLVQTAFGHDCAPLLLISTLADHTKNLLEDPRCSLLFDGTAGRAETLTGPRISLQGVAAKIDIATPEGAALAKRYLARFSAAEMYAGFKDFAFWRVAPARAHLVAGFGKIVWFDVFAYDAGDARALAEGERDVIDHMNADHGEAIDLYATRLCGKTAGGWTMSGVDPEGFDLRRHATGETLRIAFDKHASDPETARIELVRLVKRARQAGEPSSQSAVK